MFHWWQNLSVKRPWVVLGIGLVIIAGAGWYASGLSAHLKSDDNDFFAKDSQAKEANDLVKETFGADANTSVVLFERKDDALGNADSAAYQEEVAALLAPLESKDEVESITTYTSSGEQKSFISKDNSATFAVITTKENDVATYEMLRDYGDDVDQSKLTVSLGGSVYGGRQTNAQTSSDLARAEMITLPIMLILLVIFFRGVIAALIPIIMSVLTIIGAMAIARLYTGFLSIDEYAVNIITILGLGLSVDYSLLMVNRFREELKTRSSVAAAVKHTTMTAGRTVIFSGLTVIVCLLALLLFPVGFLQSIAAGATSAVAMALLVAFALLPAVFTVLGKNINRWQIVRRSKKSKKDGGLWWRVSRLGVRHPLPTIAAVVVVLGLIMIPIASFKSGAFDYHWLARGSSSQHVGDVLQNDFNSKPTNATALVKIDSSLNQSEKIQQNCDAARQLSDVEGVANVDSIVPGAEKTECQKYALAATVNMLPAQATAQVDHYIQDDYMRLPIALTDESGSAAAAQTIERLRDETINGSAVLVGGEAASTADTNAVYAQKIGLVIAVIFIGMMLLLSALLRSVVLPIQAIIMNILVIGSTVGLIVGTFQLGWGETLGFSHVNSIIIASIILFATISFGLSMDYSVFIYSRMREMYDKTKKTDVAVEKGITSTGPIITAAAMVLFVVMAAFALSSTAFVQILGFGLAVSVLIDAFIVRLLLVPAVIHIMGKKSWYAPKWLSRWSIRHE